MSAYYNEHDVKTAAWLRELIKAGLIADGEVDTRSIAEVSADDVRGFVQCHWFAGIGGWSYALRLAGWPDDRAVWTGSCPCQPFSMAGKGEGADDSRHLWPAWFRLVMQLRPSAVFGEQVASTDGLYWLDGVYVDMEASGYAVGTASLPACSVGAPHRRERLYFVADTTSSRTESVPAKRQVSVSDRALAHTDSGNGFWWSGALQVGRNAIEAEIERGGRKYRAQWRVKPGLSLLAHGIPGRVDLLRGYGNAIVPPLAAKFIKAYLEAEADQVRLRHAGKDEEP